MKLILKTIKHLFLILFLTVISQVGGLVYLISIIISSTIKFKFRFKIFSIFCIFYLLSTFFIVPKFAKLFGRERVIHSQSIKPANYMSVILNRNYVRPKLNILLQSTANKLKGTGIEIHYLDANFPLIDKFPLIPHLSHNDGKKIDISLIYEKIDGTISQKQKSMSGYGVFEAAKPGEFNQTKKCKESGYTQYDYNRYASFGKINTALVFSEKGTKLLIKSILSNNNLGKIFIEPHLKKRMGLLNHKIRFHGCHAVRHDDHIHIQLR